VRIVVERQFKIVLSDAFEKSSEFSIEGPAGELWLCEISSRRMGIDNGKDTLVHIGQTFERALQWMTEDRSNGSPARPPGKHRNVGPDTKPSGDRRGRAEKFRRPR
jgi:hypothetical protein